MSLRFHAAIAELLGIVPVPAPERMAALEQRETVCKTRFPASVREWLSLPGVESIFHDRSNDDHLEPVDALGDPGETAQGWLRVAKENQWVVAWYVRLDEGEDPPVYHNNDEWNEDLALTDWQETSPSFSAFIFDMLADDCFGRGCSGLLLSAVDRLPGPEELKALESWFRKGPVTCTPDYSVYRFADAQTLVTIEAGSAFELPPGKAKWRLRTADAEALFSAGRKLRGLGTMAETLSAQDCTPEARGWCDWVLERLRQ